MDSAVFKFYILYCVSAIVCEFTPYRIKQDISATLDDLLTSYKIVHVIKGRKGDLAVILYLLLLVVLLFIIV